jgi:hypothetical protein
VFQKRMYKVLSPIKKKDGTTFWMRLGSAFTNKDESINIYVDAIPLGAETVLQLRELTEEELRGRESKRDLYASSSAPSAPPPASPLTQNSIPF